MYLFVVFSLCISECFALKLRLLNSCVLVLLACLHYYIRRNNEIIWQHGPQLLVAVSLVVFFLVFSSLLWYEIILNVCLVLLKFCFSLLQIIVYGQKDDVSIFFLCDWFFFTCFLSVFLFFSVIAFNFYKIYSDTLRHFGIAYTLLFLFVGFFFFCCWVA